MVKFLCIKKHIFKWY